MKGYWNSPEINAQVMKKGWVYTGDVGRMDEDGYIFLMDRKKDMIVTGGSNVFSREIEDVIAGHAGVADVSVIGVPDEHWGEVVKAVVVLREGVTLEQADVIAHCRGAIAGFKSPKLVEFVEELPKNVAGKVLKAVHRERHKERLAKESA